MAEYHQKNRANDVNKIGEYSNLGLIVAGAFLSHNKEVIKGTIVAIKHPIFAYGMYQVFKSIKKEQEQKNLVGLINRS